MCCPRPCRQGTQPRDSELRLASPEPSYSFGRDGLARCNESSSRLIPFTVASVCSWPSEHRHIVVKTAPTESKTFPRLQGIEAEKDCHGL